ncbi:MAG: NUDIX domain-containing protein [Candidatus Woesearchaeota archaeon]
MEHEIELHILKKLMYAKDLGYNDILDKQFPSNAFSYHLKKIVDAGYITNKDGVYNLTPQGMHIMASRDGVSLQEKQKPIVCCFILGVRDDLILVNKRLKQPFLHYVGIPGGKLDFGMEVLESAKQEFLEETGLTGDFELKCIANAITYEEDEVAHHILGFTFVAHNLKGDLKEKHREGENFFIPKDTITKYTTYPDIPTLVESCFTEGVSHYTFNRTTKDGSFIGIDIKKGL